MFDEKTYIEREGKLKDGYIRAAAMTPKIKVADCEYNIENIKSLMSEAHKKDTAIAVFPEMCITGYTCNDLFLHDRLLNAAIHGLVDIKKYSETTPGMISFVGLPYEMNGKLYNVVAGIMNGCILGMVPKMYLPNYGEFYMWMLMVKRFPLEVNYYLHLIITEKLRLALRYVRICGHHSRQA